MKPVVYYTEVGIPPQVGSRVVIVGVKGHPRVSDGKDAITSRVTRVGDEDAFGEEGEFETENTIYRKLST